MNYFITGTDTDVGKTLICCALLHGFAGLGHRVVGFKPVASGCDDNGHNDDAMRLRAAGNVQASYGQINPYCFAQAVAPHLAAKFVGIDINLDRITQSYRELAAQADVVIVEGAGGYQVPLNGHQNIADLAMQLELPVILVVGMRLGCINHALLTAESISASGLRLAGWVANVVDGQMAMLAENIAALQQRLQAPLLGVVPYYPDGPDAREVAAKLDLQWLEQA
jgi:dethiobiotin synthetase